MIPGMNPRQLAQAMKKMGIQQVEIDAEEVIIKCPDKMLVFKNPQVSSINMMGQKNFQIIGTPEEKSVSKTPEITEEDIRTVMEQTGVDHDTAKSALENVNGNIAEAILRVSEE